MPRHVGADRQCGQVVEPPALDADVEVRLGEQRPQRGDDLPGPRQLTLHARKVLGDRRITGRCVSGRSDDADRLDGHVEGAEPADQLGVTGLGSVVAAVARSTIDRRRHEQPDVVIVTKCLDAEMGQLGELADRQRRATRCSRDSSFARFARSHRSHRHLEPLTSEHVGPARCSARCRRRCLPGRGR